MAADTGACHIPVAQVNAFIARRMEMMRSGDSTPININLKDGKVLRFSCTALPDGGRMLSYTPVTDLVRHTDDPVDTEYYRSLRGSDLGLSRALRAAEKSTTVRDPHGEERATRASPDDASHRRENHEALLSASSFETRRRRRSSG